MKPFPALVVARRWILLVVMVAGLVLSFLAGLTRAEDEDHPYLRVWTARDLYETSDRVEVLLESKIWVSDPETGNVTLVPSPGLVSLTVYDLRHDVVLREVDVPLFNGTGSLLLHVDPIWSSATIELYAVDRTNLISDTWTFRTQYSQEYMFYVLQDTWMRDDAREDARQEAQRNGDIAAAWITSSLFAALACAVVVLLVVRADQQRADDFGVESWRERFLRWISFPVSFIPDDASIAFDPERAAHAGFDVEVASQVATDLRRVQVLRLKEIRAEIDDEIDRHLAPPAPEDLEVRTSPSPDVNGLED